jgi:hypothetical protein
MRHVLFIGLSGINPPKSTAPRQSVNDRQYAQFLSGGRIFFFSQKRYIERLITFSPQDKVGSAISNFFSALS